jgi:8-oxo-dGTP pyrophosphatase MutT (NUDIX family)
MQCAASVMLVDGEGRLILGRRTDNGLWGYAGGSMELDERAEDCARRELRAEMGVTAGPLAFFCVNSGPETHYVYPNGDEVSNVEIVYLCREWTGEFRPQPEEIAEIRAFAPEELAPAMISPPIRPVFALWMAQTGRAEGWETEGRDPRPDPEQGAASAEVEPAAPCRPFDYDLLRDGTVIIRAWRGGSACLFIPDELDGHPVSLLGESTFEDHAELRRVRLPARLTHIMDGAFRHCDNLEHISYPEGLLTIGKEAFACCGKLRRVELPRTVACLDSGAFARCGALEEANLPTDLALVGDHPFYGCDSLRSLRVSRRHLFLTVKNGAVIARADHRLVCLLPGPPRETCAVPEGTERIGAWAFSRNRSLTRVTLPESLTAIGAGAFSGCDGLREVRIPAGVTFIGRDAFEGCPDLTLRCVRDTYAMRYARRHRLRCVCSDAQD